MATPDADEPQTRPEDPVCNSHGSHAPVGYLSGVLNELGVWTEYNKRFGIHVRAAVPMSGNGG